MKLYENSKIRLTDLAKALGITSSAIRQHLRNKSPLGEGAEKFGSHVTDDILLSIDSTRRFLDWLALHGRKVTMETIVETHEKIDALIK